MAALLPLLSRRPLVIPANGGLLVPRRSRGTLPTAALPMRSRFVSATILALAAIATPAVAQNVTVTSTSATTLPGNYTVATTGVTTFEKTSPGGLEFTGTISGGGSGATLFLNTSAANSLTTFTFSGSNTFAGQITLNRGSLGEQPLRPRQPGQRGVPQ